MTAPFPLSISPSVSRQITPFSSSSLPFASAKRRSTAHRPSLPTARANGSREDSSSRISGTSHAPPPTPQQLLLSYANSGLLEQAWSIWEQLLYSSFVPDIPLLSFLMNAYSEAGHFDRVLNILGQLKSRHLGALLPEAYSLALSCFGSHGQLQLMDWAFREMISSGFHVDSATGDAFIGYHSLFGSLEEMEAAYAALKRRGHVIGAGGVRAMALAYIKGTNFHRLGELCRDVGVVGRTDLGNLLWNLLLLSYAANFRMKTLQREFLSMSQAGFHPDLNTFNIRLLAFSRMALFWDLHLSLEHMRRAGVAPDLVTYGCVVDAYCDRRLGKNLGFALDKMNWDGFPQVLTDPFVFEAFGKGSFHSTSEALLEFDRWGKDWSYRELVALHLKKQERGDQIFWNH